MPLFEYGPEVRKGLLLKACSEARGFQTRDRPKQIRLEVSVQGKTCGLFETLSFTWTPKVCRIIAFYRFWAIILPTFGGLGRAAKN